MVDRVLLGFAICFALSLVPNLIGGAILYWGIKTGRIE